MLMSLDGAKRGKNFICFCWFIFHFTRACNEFDINWQSSSLDEFSNLRLNKKKAKQGGISGDQFWSFTAESRVMKDCYSIKDLRMLNQKTHLFLESTFFENSISHTLHCAITYKVFIPSQTPMFISQDSRVWRKNLW